MCKSFSAHSVPELQKQTEEYISAQEVKPGENQKVPETNITRYFPLFLLCPSAAVHLELHRNNECLKVDSNGFVLPGTSAVLPGNTDICLLAVNKTNLPVTQESDNWINWNQRSPEVSAGTCCRYQIQYVYICVCSECREELGEGEAGLYWVII